MRKQEPDRSPGVPALTAAQQAAVYMVALLLAPPECTASELNRAEVHLLRVASGLYRSPSARSAGQADTARQAC